MRRTLIPALLLLTLTAVTFMGVAGNDFILFDDEMYITGNPEVVGGLSRHGVAWAFTTFHAANWHPLTWLSHQLDVTLFGIDPAGHHLMGLALHAANALLLFLLLRAVTGAAGASLFVAALFAVHPLHIESVAWAAERKDLLSTLLVFPVIFAYLRYASRPGAARAALLPALLFVALMAKPMPVTLPLLLLALDWWPLGRWRGGPAPAREGAPWGRPLPASRLVVEKLPMLAVSAVSGVITFLAQSHGNAVSTLEGFTLPIRLGNAALGYVAYLGRTFLPLPTSVFRPHPGGAIPMGEAAAAAGLLIAATWLVWRARRSLPYLAAGWGWYVVSLLPVIGLVQVGMQATADRYTYLPLVGIFVPLTWGLLSAGRRLGLHRFALPAAGIVIILVLSAATSRELRHWRNSETLFTHALASDKGNWMAHYLLGMIANGRGETAAAIAHLKQAVAIYPGFDDAHYLLGGILLHEGATTEAVHHLSEAVRISAGEPDHYSIGGLLLARDAPPQPETSALFDRAVKMTERGEVEQAVATYRELLRLNPSLANAHNNLGVLLASSGNLPEAIDHFRAAVKLAPDLADARENLRRALDLAGKGR